MQGPPEGPRRAPGDTLGNERYCDICTNICAITKQQSAFKRLPNLEKACIMPWEWLQKERARHTYTLEVRSSSGTAFLNPGQPKKKRETYQYCILRPSPYSTTGDVPNDQPMYFPFFGSRKTSAAPHIRIGQQYERRRRTRKECQNETHPPLPLDLSLRTQCLADR